MSGFRSRAATDAPAPIVRSTASSSERAALDVTASKVADDVPVFQPDKRGRMLYRDPGRRFVAELLPDGRVHFRDKMVSGGMVDLNGALMKASGETLATRAKRAFLQRTFEQRIRVAVHYAERNMHSALKRLQLDMTKAWTRIGLSDRERRRALFALWDECDEQIVSQAQIDEDLASHKNIDAVRRRVATQARTMILRFIQQELPAGSALAYPEAELRALNKTRASAQRFEPYKAAQTRPQ